MRIFAFFCKLNLVLIFIICGSIGEANGQSVIHPLGSFCVGAANVFAYTGPGTVTSWSINGGSYTILSQGTGSIQLQWNAAVSGAYVTANRSSGGSVTYYNINIAASVTPSVSIVASANNICAGTSVTFTATPVNGGGSPVYGWYVDGTYISGGSNTFSSSSLTNGQQVTCILTTSVPCYTSYTATSAPVTMIVSQPQSLNVTISGSTSICAGSTGSFSAAVSNPTGNMSYQWKKNGSNVSSDAGSTPPYVLALNSLNNNDVISCVVSTDASCYSSGTSNSITVSTQTPQTFSISISPPGLNFCAGSTINFTTSSSHSAYNYQWYMNGSAVSGANSSTFSTTVSSVSQLQSIYVTANSSAFCLANTSASGNLTSVPFVVNPVVTPSVSISSSATTICNGTIVNFTANGVNGGGSPSYYWYVDGNLFSSGASNTYSSAALSNGQQVTCVMNTSMGCATSGSATSNAIAIMVNPVYNMVATLTGSTSICQGMSTSFGVNVTNATGTLSYQWEKNGNNISSDNPGAPAYVLVLNPGSFSNNDVISCVVSTDGCASSVTSNSLTISTFAPPSFSIGIVPPGTISFCEGSTVVFTSSANQPVSSYQWYINGSPVSSATGSSFTTTASSVAYLQSISLSAVTSVSGCIANTTANATTQNMPFSVNPYVTPTVTIIEPDPIVSNSSTTFTLSTTNSGSSPSYQWYMNGSAINGATSSSYTHTFSSGNEIQNISVAMLSNAVCAINPAQVVKNIKVRSIAWENLNYVRVHSIKVPGITDWITSDNLPVGQKTVSTTYLDGLVRPIQGVEQGISLSATGQWKDIVKPIEYDAAGRSPKDYIPYSTSQQIGKFKTDAFTDQATYIRSLYSEPANSPTYSEALYDNSPLNRVVSSIPAGQGWSGFSTGVSEDFNTATEEVHIWTIGYLTTSLPITGSSLVYPTGSLHKEIGRDEKNNKVISYSDLAGNVVLKKVQKNPDATLGINHIGWLCTYYVYDDLDRLRFTISPKAVDYLDQNNWVFSQTLSDELCFEERYDENGRLIIKKQPGATAEKMIYDNKNRLVLYQSGNQDKTVNIALAKSQWQFTIYDEQNRSIAAGLLDNDDNFTSLQQQVSALNNANITLSLSAPFSNLIEADNPIIGYLTGSSNEFYTVANNYDEYNFPGSRSFNLTFTLAYSAGTNNIEAIVKSDRTHGMITGTRARILDNDGNNSNDKVIGTVVYYDKHGRELQTQIDNMLGRYDHIVNQYDFSGKLMSCFYNHNPARRVDYGTIAKYEYDATGRLLKLSKNFNNTFYKALSEYTYNELGQVKTKRLAPGYTGSGSNQIEDLTFDYNIQGYLTGVNKDYALSTNKYNQWDHYFGSYIGYENNDGRFIKGQNNGNITGIIWKSQGDNSPRKFDFDYDNMGRFISANFKQLDDPSSSSWSNSQMDFSTLVDYEDGNGNIKSLKRMGVMQGVNGAIAIDDLRYSYLPTGISGLNGNKLKQVDDLGGLTGTNNGLLGDFKDPNGTQDYYYDAEGNLTKDLNKGISSNAITYNFLNKPVKIVIDNKSTIEFVYSALGQTLIKTITYADNSQRITTYNGDYVYEKVIAANGTITSDQIAFIIHEEGRLKFITPHSRVNDIDYSLNAGSFGINWPGNKQGVFEYFVKDQQGNTRVVLTEEAQTEFYVASMESSLAAQEEPLFGQVDNNGQVTASNELQKNRLIYNSSNPVWPGNTTDVAKLTASSSATVMGPNMILRVMAGDKISSSANYYYVSNNSAGPTSTLLNDVVGSFVSSIAGTKAGGLAKAQSTAINSILTGNADLSTFLQQHNEVVSTPKAYLNIVFFDEQFRPIASDPVTVSSIGTNCKRVTNNNDPLGLVPLNQSAPKNGWAFVFLSNESNEPVYFDNFIVKQEHSRVSEENHYYPFGLKIAGISGRAFNKLANKYNYQGDFSEEEEETGWNEYYLRSYDPQIGRWTGMDPYDEFSSPYIGMGNEPINNVDPDGGGITPGGIGSIFGAAFGFATPYIIDALNGKDHHIKNKALWGVGGAFLGAGIGHAIGATAFNNDGSSFGGNFRGYYKGLFNSQDEWVTSFNRNGAVITNSEIPQIWGGSIALPRIPLGNPFQWIPDSRNKWEYVFLATRILKEFKGDYNVDGYPNYTGNIPLTPNNGNPQIKIDGGTPSSYRLRSSYDPGTNSMNFNLDPDIVQINGLKTFTQGNYDKSGINLEDIRRASIRNTVQMNNQLKVQVYERRVRVVPFKYLKAFGIRLNFIRRK